MVLLLHYEMMSGFVFLLPPPLADTLYINCARDGTSLNGFQPRGHEFSWAGSIFYCLGSTHISWLKLGWWKPLGSLFVDGSIVLLIQKVHTLVTLSVTLTLRENYFRVHVSWNTQPLDANWGAANSVNRITEYSLLNDRDPIPYILVWFFLTY